MEPLVALLLIVAPWLIGFSDVNDAKWTSIIVGVAILAVGMTTRWRYAIVRLIPLRVHFMLDLMIGAVLIVAPFVLGFDNSDNATFFMIILGVLEIGAALATRWDPVEAYDRGTPHHGAHA
jgi:chromate transport protein ChrA